MIKNAEFEKANLTYNNLAGVRPSPLHAVPPGAAQVAQILTRPAVQMMSDKGIHSLLSAQTASAQWKLVRKGVMPAFSPNNIR